jgi:hypothetical protein
MAVNVGGCTTVNVTPLLDCPATMTVTEPLDAPAGTGAVIEVADHAVGVATVPAKETTLEP